MTLRVDADFEAPSDTRSSADVKARLFREHYPALRRAARAMTSDPELAEDLAQEAFVRAWKKLDALAEDPGAVRAYLRTTLVNLIRRSFRRRMLEIRSRMLSRDPSPHVPDQAARIAVTEAIKLLPPKQRACVVLRYLEDLSEADTASILGVSVGTVKSQTHRGLARLEQILGKETDG
jgi:RNA polymerase sigma-70 factor (sigma-E family)